MPLQTGPACIASEDCPIVPIPTATGGCVPELSDGGVNDIYIIPCTEALTEANVLDVEWWNTLKTAGKLGNLGVGVGSIGKKSVVNFRVSSCRPAEITGTTWALKYTIATFDKTSEDITTTQVNALLHKAGSYQLVARMWDDGRLTVRVEDDGERLALVEQEPALYSTTDHHAGTNLVLIAMDVVDSGTLQAHLAESWWWAAPPVLRRRYPHLGPPA